MPETLPLQNHNLTPSLLPPITRSSFSTVGVSKPHSTADVFVRWKSAAALAVAAFVY